MITYQMPYHPFALLALLATLALSGCADEAPQRGAPALPGPGEPCEGESQTCADGLDCLGGLCGIPDDAGIEDEEPACPDNGVRCDGICCPEGELCDNNRCVTDCPTVLCEGICCDEGLLCEQGACLPPCDGLRCGDDLGLCCEGETVCFAGACLEPGDPCTQTEECDVDEICEPSIGRCLSRDNVNVCEFRPPVAEFTPELGCRWTPEGLAEHPNRNDVVATPIVINLTDDNMDGLTNADDFPEVVFLTYDLEEEGCCNRASTLRIVSGTCQPDQTMLTLASISEPAMDNSGGIASGDLDGDGVPEIVAIGMFATNPNNSRPLPQGVIAWERVSDDGSEWQVRWTNTTHPTYDLHTRGGALISLADLDGNGRPEVIVGNIALDGRTGRLIWDGVETSGGDGGIGNNAFLGPYASVADLNGDGLQEVAAGNTLYASDGTVLWTYPYETNNSVCGGQLPCDGFTAIANFDEDLEGEVVIVRRGEVFIINFDGSLLWQQAIPLDDCPFNESGPPTVADFDGDGRPEIGTAAADFYTVLDMDCDADPVPEGCASRGVLWNVPNQDCSSRVTASSVFDFEGDGKAEMVYADETTFRIFDGTTGTILYEDDTHGSHTRIEMPVIADVDNDGNSEIIIPENGSNGGQPGLEIFRDAQDNWVRTRRIWNQHAYSVTNIDEDGHIPAAPEQNWLNGRLNNFRQNVQPGGLFDAPDLVLSAITPDTDRCGNELILEIEVRVANEGALSVPSGLPVLLEALNGGEATLVAAFFTSDRLLPGQTEIFGAAFQVPDEFPDTFTLRAAIDADGEINECREDNNISDTEVTCALIR